MSIKTKVMMLLAAGLTTAVVVPSGSAAGADEATTIARGCERQFHSAVQAYVRTTDRRDADAFAALLHNDFTGIFPDGEVLSGKKAGMDFFREFFADPSWTQTFTPVRTTVQGCNSGFVLFDSTYTQPGVSVHMVIGLSWTRERGKWLVIQDQNTAVAD
jgi:uncharacterized protein (TIGR02246 family)